MGIETSKFSPKIEKEKYVELFQTIYQEMKNIAEETGFAKQYQDAAKYKKRRLSKFLEETHLKPLRDRLIKQNPEYAEVIAILVDLNTTSWQVLATDLLAHNDNKTFAHDFWRQREAIENLFRPTNTLESDKRGIIGQVGAFKAFEKLGITPVLATPRQDAEGADLFIIAEELKGFYEPVVPVSVRHGVSHRYHLKKENIYKKAESVKVELKEKPVMIDSSEIPMFFSQGLHTSVNFEQNLISWFKKVRAGKGIKFLKVICPLGSFDPDTGDPSPAFLKKFDTQMAKYF